MTLRHRVALGVTLVTALAAATPASAQELRPTDERRTNAPGYFFYVLPGERTTQATVLGTVRAPGFYEVSAGTDLAELLALAGGPAVGVESPDIERRTTITLYRPSASGAREVIYQQTTDAFARGAEPYPVMLDGDTVEVTMSERRRWNWRDTLTVVGGSASVVIAIVQIIQTLQ